TSTAGQAAAFAPGSVLFGDLSHGLGGGARTHLLFGRQTQHLAVLQAVDVAVDEGVGVQVLNGQHGLVNGAARYATGDFPESVVIGGAVFALKRSGRGAAARGGAARAG